MKIVQSIGDGSCLIHSILHHISPGYTSMSNHEKMIHVRNIRNQLANEISQSYYDQLNHGVLKEVISYEQWKQLMLSNNPLGQECIEVLSDYFEVNLFIYYQDYKLYPMDVYYNKNYKDVFIYWSGNHYDAFFWSDRINNL